MTTKYMTILIEYEDGANTPTEVTKAFAENKPFGDVMIQAVSLEDEFSRLEAYESEIFDVWEE